MCSSAALGPPPLLFPPSEVLSIDALTVKCSLCLRRWPHQLGQSLMTHYTHINRTKHKQSSQSYCIRLHMQHSSVSQPLLSRFLSPPPLSLFLSLYFSPSVSLFTVSTVARMDAHRVSRMLRRCNFWKWKWKLAPIRKTNKVTSILYVCQVVEGIQRENIALHPAFRLSSR